MTYNQLQPQCLHNFCSVASLSRPLCCKTHWLPNVRLDVMFPSDMKNTPESWVGVIPWGCLWTRSLKAVISFLLVWLLCTNSIFLFPACFSSCPFRCTGFRILSVSLVHRLHWFEIRVSCFCSPNKKKTVLDQAVTGSTIRLFPPTLCVLLLVYVITHTFLWRK